MPLEKKEWMVSVVWHYDMNRLTPTVWSIFPSANAYWGVGENCNLGFGISRAAFDGHLSAAKYWPDGEDNYWAGYIHFNGLVHWGNHPQVEFGGQYSHRNSGFRQDIAVGLAWGFAPAWVVDPYPEFTNHFSGGLLPYLRYSAYGKNLGFSWKHYHGITRRLVMIAEPNLLTGSDTLLNYDHDEIEGFYELDRFHNDVYVGEGAYLLRLTSGDSVMILAERLGECAIGSATMIPSRGPRNIADWLGGTERYYEVDYTWAIFDIDKVIAEWEAGRDVVVTRYPASLAEKVQTLQSWKVDNSFGLGLSFLTDWGRTEK